MSKASALTSGTIKGMFLSFLKHEELSTTKHPCLTALGAYSLAVSDPAEKNAKSTLEKSKFSKQPTIWLEFLKVTSLPYDFLLASNWISERKK